MPIVDINQVRLGVARALRNLAEFRFRDLSHWRDSVSIHLLGTTPGVAYVDLDESRNRVVIGVSADRPIQVERAIANQLASFGIPTRAVEFEPTSGSSATQGYGNTLLDTSRPLLAGTIVYPSGCTMGPLLKVDGVVYASTASHCSLPMGQVTGISMHQITPLFVGNEVMDPAPHNINGYTNARVLRADGSWSGTILRRSSRTR